MDSHLISVPGLGTLTVRGLTGGNTKNLSGEADRALDGELLGASTVDELLADLLEGGNLAGGQGDANLVDLLWEVVNTLVIHDQASKGAARAQHGARTYGTLAKILLGLLIGRHFEIRGVLR